MTSIQILIFILVALILVLLGLVLLNKSLINKRQKAVLIKLRQLGPIEKEGKDYYLVLGTQQIQLIFLSLKHNEHLTVNSNTKMQIDRYKNDKPIILRYNYQFPPFKWLLVIPGINRVKRAVNENEVVFIDYTYEFDNFRIIKETEVDLLITEIQNNK